MKPGYHSGWIDDYDNNRIIYVHGTAGKYDVCIFDKKTKTGKKVAEVDLPHSFYINPGPKGKVWFTLGGGLMSVNPDTGEVKRYE